MVDRWTKVMMDPSIESSEERWHAANQAFLADEREAFRKRMRREPYDPKVLGIVMRYDCVFSCDHCFFSSSPRAKEEFGDDEVDEAIDFAAERGMVAVVLSGGEPMRQPQKVFRAVERIKRYGIDAVVQTAFMGLSENEVQENAAMFGSLGVDRVLTSLSMYHDRSRPEGMDDYLDYLVGMIDAITSHAIPVDIKNTWDVTVGENSTDHSNEFAKRLIDKGAAYMGQPMGPDSHMFFMNEAQVDITDPCIIIVGKARTQKLKGQNHPDVEDHLYKCPIFNEPHHEGGMFQIYPDGNVARCCSAERNADFGFGNTREMNYDTLLTNMRTSNFVNPWVMEDYLREGHAMLQEEFPHLLPEGGALQACEICSPIVARPELKARLAERLEKPDMFEPRFVSMDQDMYERIMPKETET